MLELVNPDNFNRAESDTYFSIIANEGGFGRFEHHRQLMPIDHQIVVRPNRDTLYSSAVFDLDAGPVTITLPDAGPRFLSLQVIDEDQYATSVVYGQGTYTFTREQVGTRYALMGVRILVDPRDPADLERVHALQDRIIVDQPEPGKFEVPQWDKASQGRVRDALLALAATVPDSRRMFGTRDQVEPVRHLIGTAAGWGGNPEKDATYLMVTPSLNDGSTIYRLTVADVPVDGFWSISVYNAKGYFQTNPYDLYTINSLSATRNPDGSITVQFGGCKRDVPNCLPIMPGWNYTVRLYRPRAEILDGQWQFPEARPVTPAFRHATEAVVWGTPLVSFDAMRQAFARDGGARYNDILFWAEPADWRLQLATPHASARYVYFNFNTGTGPVVLEVPPAVGAGLFGSILDAWQVPVVDVGPHGEDRGKGAKYLLLPPGDHDSELAGAIPVRLDTYNGHGVLRAIADSAAPEAVERALQLVRALRLYSLVRADQPPPQRLIDMTGKTFDGIVRYDDTFFDSLARMIDEEPVLPRDTDVTLGLAAFGIEQSAPFTPNARTRQLLAGAARSVHEAYMRGAATEGAIYWEGRQWRAASSAGARTSSTFMTESGLDTAARGMFFYLACAPPAKLGDATFYLVAFVDREGRPLDGARRYRLCVPARVPAAQFWAATVYDVATAAFVRESPRVELSSYDLGSTSADDATEVCFGPSAPRGKEAAWLYTAPGRSWFAMFRFYGPLQPLFDKTWQLPDIELVSHT